MFKQPSFYIELSLSNRTYCFPSSLCLIRERDNYMHSFLYELIEISMTAIGWSGSCDQRHWQPLAGPDHVIKAKELIDIRKGKIKLVLRQTKHLPRKRSKLRPALAWHIERQASVKLLGVWLDQDGGWNKQFKELCKTAYKRMSFLTNLRYAGVSRNNLIHNYKQFLRTAIEYCSVAIHSSLTEAQSNS